MAEKRLFSKKIVESDAFLEMRAAARCLYFSLGMNADDDGFVGAPKGIMRLNGATQKDLETLINRRFILRFESGVVVLKHWFAMNYIPKDRYTPTTHIKERSLLVLDENKVYIEKEKADRKFENPVDKLYTECIQNDDKMYTQNKLNKNKLNYNITSARAHAREKTKNDFGAFDLEKFEERLRRD